MVNNEHSTCSEHSDAVARHNAAGALIDCGCGWGDLCGMAGLLAIMMGAPFVVLGES